MAILVAEFVVVSTVSLCVTAVSLEDLYPYGLPQDKQILTNDDGSSLRIDLDPPFRFYNQSYNGCHIHNNGIVSFNDPPEYFLNEPFPIANYTLVAPFFGDVDTRKAGTVWYTDPVSNDSDTLEKARKDISQAFACYNFSPTYLVIATWDHVGYFKEQKDKLNTFQCVIATDGDQSYAIFLYNETEWTTQYDPDDPDLNPTPAKVGFNYGYSNKSWEIPFSRTPEVMNISMSSNIGQPGVWIFRIDKEEIIPACVNEGQEMCFSRHATCLTAQYDFRYMCSSSNTTCSEVDEKDNGSGRALRTGIGIGIVIGIVIGSGFVGVVCVCIVILRSRKKFRKL